MTTGYLARTRIGTAAVDISIPETVTAGESVAATVELWGGTTDERAEGLAAVFGYGSSARTEHERVSARVPLADPFTIPAADHRVLGTEIQIPHRVPVTLGDTRVRFGIEEPSGPDGLSGEPSDAAPPDHESTASPHRHSSPNPADREDAVATDGGKSGTRWASLTMAGRGTGSIQMRPGERLAQVLDAVSALGFFLVAAEPVADPDEEGARAGSQTQSRRRGSVPLQEIRFRPRWGPYATAGDLFLYPAPAADRLDIGVVLADDQPPREADRRPVADRDRLTVRQTGRRAVRADLRQLLERQAVES